MTFSPCSPFFRFLRLQSPDPLPPTSIREAVTTLREYTKLTREEISRRLFLTTGQFTNLETHGRPLSSITTNRLIAISQEYHFPSLEKFFSEILLTLKVKNFRRKIR